MRLRLHGFLLALLVAASPTAPAFAEDVTYTNPRFGTQLTFPADVFSAALEPPANGDGMTWMARDGASLAVYGMNNALMATPEELADRASEPDGRTGFKVTYRRVADDWLVLSGFEDGSVFYHRFELGADDVIHAMLLKYPVARKAKYDPMVGRIAGTLDGP